MNIDTSLLREKFLIKERKERKDDKVLEFTACSNRMVINLQAGELPTETFIVRSNTMHNCIRMVSKVMNEYERRGPLLRRAKSLDWNEIWEKTLSPFERRYNDDRWVCIYNKGKIVYTNGKHHQFLDVIEKCDAAQNGDYNKSIPLAEAAFKKAGKNITLTYESNVALVAILNRKEGRCSMILRGPDRTTTFNFNIKASQETNRLNLPHGLTTASDFLEGVQLAYLIGYNAEKLSLKLIDKASDDYNKMLKAQERLNEIDAQISAMENSYKMRYRPERPDFNLIIETSKRCASERINNEDEIFIE